MIIVFEARGPGLPRPGRQPGRPPARGGHAVLCYVVAYIY